jgi:hypothetical protein
MLNIKYSLIIYGQLRTVEICLNDILLYIDYIHNNFDIYLIIDKKNDINFNKKLKFVKNILNKNIKKIWFINDIININKENEIYNNYINKCLEIIDKTKKDFNLKECIYNHFVSKLYYRRLLILQTVNNYISINNLKYNKLIFTRFDINLREKIINKNILFDDNTYIHFDIFFCASMKELLNIFEFSNNYFSIYNHYLKYGINEIIKYFNIKKNDITNFIKIWICMPEANFDFYLKTKNIKFIKLGSFKIQREINDISIFKDFDFYFEDKNIKSTVLNKNIINNTIFIENNKTHLYGDPKPFKIKLFIIIYKSNKYILNEYNIIYIDLNYIKYIEYDKLYIINLKTNTRKSFNIDINEINYDMINNHI